MSESESESVSVSESESEVASATNREFVEFNCYPFKAKDLADTPSEKREREKKE